MVAPAPRSLPATTIKGIAVLSKAAGNVLRGEDWRERPLHERRTKLHEVVHSIPGGSRFDTSGQVRAPSWETLAIARSRSREEGTEA